MLEQLIKLLGRDNAQKLEDGIIDIVLEQIRNDFTGYSRYILDPDDITVFTERCKEKAFKNIESELVKKMEDTMRKSLLQLNEE